MGGIAELCCSDYNIGDKHTLAILESLQVLLNRGGKDLIDGQLTDKFVQAIVCNLKNFQGNAKVAGSKEASLRASLAATSLVAVISMGDSVFKLHVREIFPILTELIAFPSATREILESVSVIFSEKVNPLL